MTNSWGKEEKKDQMASFSVGFVSVATIAFFGFLVVTNSFFFFLLLEESAKVKIWISMATKVFG